MRQIEPRQFNSVFTLLAGSVAGLLLGLFIGWVVWPVEWQGATLNELFPTQKAEYLGAVADAYAITHTPEAAEVARQRVAPLGDLSTEMAAAISYYSGSSDPNREIRIGNLSLLASTLGISTPGLVGVTQNTQSDSAAVSAPAVAAATPVSSANTTTPSWLAWLTYVLGGLLLLLAGLYLLLQQRQNSAQSSAQMGEHIDRQIGSLGNSAVDPWERRTHSYVAAEDDPAYPATATNGDDWQQATPSQPIPENEYRFDDEPEAPSHVRPAGGNWVGATQGSHVAQLRLDEATDTQDEEDDFGEEQDAASYRPAQSADGVSHPTMPVMPERPFNAEVPPSYTRPEGRPLLDLPTQGALVAAPISSSDRPVSLTRSANKQHKLLEIYTAQYQVGLRDYDESHPIMDPSAGKYVGECGMGTSTKNSLLQNNPDQVVALEVWLFDKTDERNVGTQTRVLLSEYAIDHNLVQAFLKERQDDPRPFTAQPNTRFQLESQNLLLDCTITETIYVPSGPTKGIFQSVKVEMSVYKKG